jgi:hypothetical protein
MNAPSLIIGSVEHATNVKTVNKPRPHDIDDPNNLDGPTALDLLQRMSEARVFRRVA